MAETLTRTTWHKIGEYIFSESGKPLIKHDPRLKDYPDFTVLDDPDFAKLLGSVKDFNEHLKIHRNINNNKISALSVTIEGAASNSTQTRRVLDINKTTREMFDNFVQIMNTSEFVDLTEYYKKILDCKTAVAEYKLSLKRVCSYYKGYGFVGESRYLEFFKSDLTLPIGHDLSIIDASNCPGFISYEDSKFLHTTIAGKQYLIIKDNEYTIFYKKEPQPKTDFTKLYNFINASLANKQKPTWIIDYGLHSDIKKYSSDMHLLSTHMKQNEKMNSIEYVLTSIEMTSMTSKNAIKIDLKEENSPKLPVRFSTICMFKSSLKKNERIVVYTFKNAIAEGKDMNLIEYQKNTSKTDSGLDKDEDNPEAPNWEVRKYGLIV